MRQEIGYFDDDAHSPGVLVTRLADEAAAIKGLTGPLMGIIFQSMASFVVGLGIAFYYSWQLTLVILACVPIVAVAGYLDLAVLEGSGKKTKAAYESAAQIAIQAIQNIRTVLTLGRERQFHDDYLEKIKIPHANALKAANYAAFAFGFSQGSIYFIYALAFYFGARLIVWGSNSPTEILSALFAVIFTAMSAGNMAAFMPVCLLLFLF
jgi:ABC-type multidrug transport system fused ATPase/permease subunit